MREVNDIATAPSSEHVVTIADQSQIDAALDKVQQLACNDIAIEP